MTRLKVLFVSDVHYRRDLSSKPHRALGLKAVEEIVEKEGPDLLLSAGDWDVGFGIDEFDKLASRVHVLTIYGNHENRSGIQSARNRDGTPVLLPDADPVEYEGLVVAGISGNLGSGKKWHHKTLDAYRRCVERLEGSGIDVLVTHEAPAKVPFIPSNPYGKRVVLEAALRVRPHLHFSGHVDYPTQCVRYGSTLFLHVDSQPPAFEYAVGVFEDGSLREMTIKRMPATPLKTPTTVTQQV